MNCVHLPIERSGVRHLNIIQCGIENYPLRPPAAMWHRDRSGERSVVMRRRAKATIFDAASSIRTAQAALQTSEDQLVTSQ
jgi:hypothetical protein